MCKVVPRRLSHCTFTLVKVSKTKMKVLVRSTSLFFFFFLPRPMVCAISVPQPGTEPVPPAVDGHLNHGHDGQGGPPAEQGGWHMGCTL